MGNRSSSRQPRPVIKKEDLDYLLKKTNITAREIKHWYRIYMVSIQNIHGKHTNMFLSTCKGGDVT